MTNIFNGVQLAKCFDLVSKAGHELTALHNTLDTEFSKAISEKTSFRLQQNQSIYTKRRDDSFWVYTDTAKSLALISKRKKLVDKYFNFQISLLGDGIGFGEKTEPLLHVSLWGSAVNLDEGVYMYIPYPASSDDDLWELDYGERIMK